MKTTIYWIPAPTAGKLGIMPRPRGGDWLSDEVTSLVTQEVHTLVSLLEASEVDELDLKNEGECCSAVGINFLSFPIPDRGVPSSRHAFAKLAATLALLLDEGKNVTIHCRAGVGRSTLLAALVLAPDLGEMAFETISGARGLAVPDTQEQIDWYRQQLHCQDRGSGEEA